MTRRLRQFLLLSLGSPLLVACGGTPEESSPAPPPPLLSTEEVSAHPAGSPERTVLEWWRQVQYRNTDGALQFYARGAQPSSTLLNSQIAEVGDSFRGIPEVADVSQVGPQEAGGGRSQAADGNAAGQLTVFLTVEQGEAEQPAAVSVVQEGNEWKLANNLLLEQKVLMAEERIAEGSAGSATQDQLEPGEAASP